MAGTMDQNSTQTWIFPRDFFKKRIAVPPEKGAWVWLLGPMIAGLAATPAFGIDTIIILIGAVAAYMLRQPATLAAKNYRRAKAAPDTPLIAAWFAIYTAIALAAGAALLLRGHLWVIALGLPGLLLFARHLWLVAKNDERHRIGMDLAAAGMLALTAPAIVLVHDTTAWLAAAILWLILSLQASGSIVHMFLRLEQRRLKSLPTPRERWQKGAIPVAHHAANTLFAIAAVALSIAPWLIIPAFAITLIEGVAAVHNPPVGHTPRQLGMRQLWISSAFTVLVALGYIF